MLSSTAEISFQLTLNLCALCMRGGKRLWNDIQASERLSESSKWGKMCFQDKFNSEILLGKCRVVLGCPCSAPFAIFISGLVRRWRFWRIKRQPSGVNEKGIGHVGLLYMAKDNKRLHRAWPKQIPSSHLPPSSFPDDWAQILIQCCRGHRGAIALVKGWEEL